MQQTAFHGSEGKKSKTKEKSMVFLVLRVNTFPSWNNLPCYFTTELIIFSFTCFLIVMNWSSFWIIICRSSVWVSQRGVSFSAVCDTLWMAAYILILLMRCQPDFIKVRSESLVFRGWIRCSVSGLWSSSQDFWRNLLLWPFHFGINMKIYAWLWVLINIIFSM